MLSENTKKTLDKYLNFFKQNFADKFEEEIKWRVERRNNTFNSFHSSETINSLSLDEFKIDSCTFYKDHDKIIFQGYEGYIIKALNLYCSILNKKSVDGPCVAFLSILGIKGYKIVPAGSVRIKKIIIDRENLLLPDMYIEDISDFSAPEVMKPAFDMVWNACGYSGSKNYKDGQWISS